MAHIRHSHLNRWCTHTVSISYIQDFLIELKNRKFLIDTNLVHALSQKLESCSLHFLKNLIFQEQFNNTFCNIFITGSKVTVSLRLLTRHSVNLLSSQMYEYHFIRHFLPQILKLNAGLSLFLWHQILIHFIGEVFKISDIQRTVNLRSTTTYYAQSLSFL